MDDIWQRTTDKIKCSKSLFVFSSPSTHRIKQSGKRQFTCKICNNSWGGWFCSHFWDNHHLQIYISKWSFLDWTGPLDLILNLVLAYLMIVKGFQQSEVLSQPFCSKKIHPPPFGYVWYKFINVLICVWESRKYDHLIMFNFQQLHSSSLGVRLRQTNYSAIFLIKF